MKARVKWVQDATMVGESGSGHALVMDGPPEHGGRDLGVRPMEMLLLGMGGCTEFDVLRLGVDHQKVVPAIAAYVLDRDGYRLVARRKDCRWNSQARSVASLKKN